MAFDGDMQAAGAAIAQTIKFRFKFFDLGQHLVGQTQKAQTSGGKLHRLGTAHKEFDTGLLFQAFDLVGQSRLGDVELIGGTGQTATFMDRAHRAQVAEFDVHLHMRLMTFLRIMNLRKDAMCGT